MSHSIFATQVNIETLNTVAARYTRLSAAADVAVGPAFEYNTLLAQANVAILAQDLAAARRLLNAARRVRLADTAARAHGRICELIGDATAPWMIQDAVSELPLRPEIPHCLIEVWDRGIDILWECMDTRDWKTAEPLSRWMHEVLHTSMFFAEDVDIVSLLTWNTPSEADEFAVDIPF
jgi:hypothetical protein